MPGLFGLFGKKDQRPPPDYEAVRRQVDAIEAEMRRVGLWFETPPTPEQFQFTQAFAADTMAYDQWLQYVFLPNVRKIIDQRGQFPKSSSVGAYAVREFDTSPFETDHLLTLLNEFDRMF